jgi:peptide-methionine (S)-S-oxide reductase
MGIIEKIGFGGGCHWCTEAIFQSLIGVESVEQGWIASEGEASTFSEAVVVHFDSSQIALAVLVEIHLHTHQSTSAHSMRKKYRSAVYYFDTEQKILVKKILKVLNATFDTNLITSVLLYSNFKPSGEAVKNYYYKDPKKPFCETFIDPKLKLLINQFSSYTDNEKLNHLSPD